MTWLGEWGRSGWAGWRQVVCLAARLSPTQVWSAPETRNIPHSTMEHVIPDTGQIVSKQNKNIFFSKYKIDKYSQKSWHNLLTHWVAVPTLLCCGLHLPCQTRHPAQAKSGLASPGYWLVSAFTTSTDQHNMVQSSGPATDGRSRHSLLLPCCGEVLPRGGENIVAAGAQCRLIN